MSGAKLIVFHLPQSISRTNTGVGSIGMRYTQCSCLSQVASDLVEFFSDRSALYEEKRTT